MMILGIYTIVTILVEAFVYVIAMNEERRKFPFAGIGEFFGIMFVVALWPILFLNILYEAGTFLYNVYNKRRKRLTDLRVMIEQKYDWYN